MEQISAVRKVIRKLKDNGFIITHVFDGEIYVPVHNKEKEIIEAVESVDDSLIRVKSPLNSNSYHIQIVLEFGGCGVDAICDWSYYDKDADGFNALMDEVTKEIDDSENKEC